MLFALELPQECSRRPNDRAEMPRSTLQPLDHIPNHRKPVFEELILFNFTSYCFLEKSLYSF
jgi:hypothetical protein